MREQLALLPEYLGGHVELTMAALVLAAAIGIPLGVLAARRPRLESLALGIAGAVQTVPALALLAVTVPALAALGMPSIGVLPALVGLTLYGVLPMLRNTVVGIATVDRALLEAARGVGMTEGQTLRWVQLPVALPVIVAGVRTAAVWVVGTATLATPVGATSLGNYIFAGLHTRNTTAILVGCIAAAALALVLDTLIRLLERGASRRGGTGARIAAAGLLVLAAGSWVQLGRSLVASGPPPITIGTKPFTEQYVLGAILAGQVERMTGRPTRLVPSLGSTVAFDALAAGGLDAYVDYTGTLWATVLEAGAPPSDPAEVLAEVDRRLRAASEVAVAAALGFENTYVLAVRGEDARAGLATISDLAPRAPGLVMAGDYEIFARPEWASVVATYGLAFREQRTMDPSLMYAAVASRAVDVVTAYSTDGRIAAYDLAVLADDRHAIPPYDAVVLVGTRLVRDAPDVAAALGALAGSIDAAAMRAMNAAVDRDGESPAAVAARFLSRTEAGS